MADQRVTQACILTDPSTPAQQASVDISGHLQVDLAADSVGGIEVIQDTAADFNCTEASAAAILADTTAIIADVTDIPNVIGTDGAVGPTKCLSIGGTNAGNIQELEVDADGQLHIVQDVAADLNVTEASAASILSDTTNILADTAAIDTATGNIDTATTDIPNVIGTDGVAGPTKCVSIGGTEAGGNIQEMLVDADGHLQIDVLTGGGAETPTNPTSDHETEVGLAVATPTRLDASTDLGGVTEKLTQVTVASSVPVKATIQGTEDGSVTNTFDTVFCPAGGTVIWTPPHRNYAEVIFGTNAGFDGWSVTLTNLDSVDAADVYVSFYWEE